ncbi:MAG TPA: alpha-ribazole phosphatase [Pyrinomonadaceae bacterium]|nr:alpha-ribazole phosphatase [Pyrinomonadaceae bacterium]
MTPSDPTQRLRLYLIRHGEVEGAAEGRVFGQTDVPLSKRGLQQSRLLADRLASTHLRAVYSSDLKRASQAAEMIASRHGLNLQRDAAWREINMGLWDGRSIADLHTEAAVEVEKLFSDPMSFTYPDGESFSSFAARVQTTLDQLLRVHPHGEVAVVTHGGVCRTIIGGALEIPMRNWLRLTQDYGSLNVIDWYGANPVLRQINAI